MFRKELKKLSRRELIDIIYQMKKNEQKMQEEIASLQEALQDKRMRISAAGSIADAAASITGVFSAAQMTADLYLYEISCMKEETEKKCKKMVETANGVVTKLLSDGEKQYADINARYQSTYTKWQQLQAQVRTLEEAQRRTSHEGAEDDKTT